MYHGVDASDLVFSGDAESDRLLNRRAEKPSNTERVDRNTEATDRLSAQLGERSALTPDKAVEEANAGAEEPDVQGSDETTDEVDAHNVKRVVESELVFEIDR